MLYSAVLNTFESSSKYFKDFYERASSNRACSFLVELYYYTDFANFFMLNNWILTPYTFVLCNYFIALSFNPKTHPYEKNQPKRRKICYFKRWIESY